MHFRVGTAMPSSPGEVKSSALRTVFRRISVSSTCCCSVSSMRAGGAGVAVMVLLKHCAMRSRSWGSEYGAAE
eukprot:4004065-Prorocentrum_lima.AAC.1